MKKLLVVIFTLVLCLTFVNAEESNFLIKDVKVVKSSDGVVLNDKNNINAIFNDLNQQIKYEATIENKSDKKLYLNFIEVENSSEKFMEYKLDTKSENKVLEPNSSSKINFYVNTLEIEGAGRNLIDDVKINFMISDKIFNPNTFSNIIELIVLLVILGFVTYFFKRNKKVKTMILIIGISIIGIEYVYANDYIKVLLPGNIQYISQNNIIASGTTLNGKQADYTNSKEVWAYYDKVKNVEVKSLINEPKDYYKKFDLTENKTGRVMAYLVENNDKNTPYDLKIMSKGVVIANKDSSFMFSFPNTEKVEGLTNVDFRNATTMQGMFIGNENLKKVEVDAIELINTVDTSYMFYDCEEIEHNKKEFNIDENKVNTENMFIQYLYNEVKYGAKVEIDENFTKSPSESNLRGNFIRKDSLEEEYPIYYYRGNVTDNNVKFAGYCWQIVRTTETGGVKLVYNGKPNEDGTCKEPGVDISVATSAFNSRRHAINSAGYMYGTTINTGYQTDVYNRDVVSYINRYDDTQEYYYSKEYEYKDGIYTLKNPVAKVWQENYENLNGYYTCDKTTTEGCETIHYIIGDRMGKTASIYGGYTYTYTNGENENTKVFNIGESYIKTDQGKYQLKEVISYSKIEYMKNYEQINNGEYYACKNLQDTECDQIYRVTSAYPAIYYVYTQKTRIYGKEITYKDGMYQLKDTISSNCWWCDFEKIITEYRYTCLNNSDQCSKVNYLYDYSNQHYMAYLPLTNGKTVDDVLTEGFTNQNDSDIKKVIDNWYEQNILSYSNQLEDTVWCNDKQMIDGGFANKTEKVNYISPRFAGYNRTWSEDTKIIELSCSQKNDSYTVSEKNGNGALKYPIGLLTSDEVKLSGYGYAKNYAGESYLSSKNTNATFITMTPVEYMFSGYSKFNVASPKGFTWAYNTDKENVRPAISLKNKIKYLKGNGTKENPYVIEGIEQ